MTPGGIVVTQCHKTFAHDPASITEARHTTRSFLAEYGEADDRFAIELLVSELVTNAVRHGTGPIELTMSIDVDLVRVTVGDHGGRQPVLRPRPPDAAADGGMGLRLVDDLATAWGTRIELASTTVWFHHQLTSTDG
jgi:anti-sigma regulatory factor (Ser/Thr protein kinase)